MIFLIKNKHYLIDSFLNLNGNQFKKLVTIWVEKTPKEKKKMTREEKNKKIDSTLILWNLKKDYDFKTTIEQLFKMNLILIEQNYLYELDKKNCIILNIKTNQKFKYEIEKKAHFKNIIEI